jgi:hypothetical protein
VEAALGHFLEEDLAKIGLVVAAKDALVRDVARDAVDALPLLCGGVGVERLRLQQGKRWSEG